MKIPSSGTSVRLASLYSICWPAAICLLLGYYEIVGQFPILGSAYAELGWFLATVGYAATRPLVVWLGLFIIAGMLPYLVWRRPPHCASIVCLMIAVVSIQPALSPTLILKWSPLALVVLAAIWTERLGTPDRNWVWVRVPLLLLLLAIGSALLFWVAWFPLREVVGARPALWAWASVSLSAVAVLAVLRPFRRRWSAAGLIAVAIAFNPAVNALLNENFEIRQYQPPIDTRASPPVVVLILVDTLRVDALSYANPDAGATPRIDAFAAESVVFANAVSPAPWTFPAMQSIMTGIAPLQEPDGHGYTTPETHTLGEYLEDRGYHNRAIVGNLLLSRPYQITNGFLRIDTFARRRFGERVSGLSLEAKLPPKFVNGGSTEYLTNQATDWIADARSRPSFLWLHYMAPHDPYLPPLDLLPDGIRPSAGSSFGDVRAAKSLYMAEVSYIDREVGRFLQAMKEAGLYDDALIILTSDHGEEFLEHGGISHGHTLYQELLHVPLVFKLPNRKTAKRIENFVTTQALLPTVLDIVGIDAPKQPGWVESLLPLIVDDSAVEFTNPIISGATTHFKEFYQTERQWSVILDGMKYIHRIDSGREELYRPHHAQRPPMPRRHALTHAPSPLRASVAPRHFRGDAAFVQENQLLRIDLAHLLAPYGAPLAVRLAVLLGGVE